jgi:hypothetical protein
VLLGRLVQPELVEDARYVAFHGGYSDHELLRDAGVGESFGDQGQYFCLTFGQAVEGAAPAPAPDQAGNDIRVQR